MLHSLLPDGFLKYACIFHLPGPLNWNPHTRAHHEGGVDFSPPSCELRMMFIHDPPWLTPHCKHISVALRRRAKPHGNYNVSLWAGSKGLPPFFAEQTTCWGWCWSFSECFLPFLARCTLICCPAFGAGAWFMCTILLLNSLSFSPHMEGVESVGFRVGCWRWMNSGAH